MSFESNFIPTAMAKTYLDSDPDCTVKGIDLDPDCTVERNDLEPGCKEMIRIRIALKTMFRHLQARARHVLSIICMLPTIRFAVTRFGYFRKVLGNKILSKGAQTIGSYFGYFK